MCVVGRQNGAQGSQIWENPTFGAEEVCASHGRERFMVEQLPIKGI
jgi:hypothetical protein